MLAASSTKCLTDSGVHGCMTLPWCLTAGYLRKLQQGRGDGSTAYVQQIVVLAKTLRCPCACARRSHWTQFQKQHDAASLQGTGTQHDHTTVVYRQPYQSRLVCDAEALPRRWSHC